MNALATGANINTGDTAWMLVATALVLMMTPALGLFYAGLVRAKNTLNTFMMCVGAIAVVTVTWAVIGYSLAFDKGNGVIGGFRYVLLHDVTFAPRPGTTIPHLLFMAFEATFCIITAALVAGAVVERMRFGPFLLFIALWSVLVFPVLAHWVWGGGWLVYHGTLDFAGGVPVEMASGFSAFAAAIVVGARRDYGRQALLPHNAVYALIVWRPRTRLDETLDVLAAHGLAGFTGILFIGFFAQHSWNGVSNGLIYGNSRQLAWQAIAACAAPVYSFVATFLILKAITL